MQTPIRLNKRLRFCFILLLLFSTCSKENIQTEPATDIEEYFTPKETNIKHKIRDFLYAVNRLPAATFKTDSFEVLEDKEPNEGVWLMEAAINVDPYSNLEKEPKDRKEYQI